MRLHPRMTVLSRKAAPLNALAKMSVARGQCELIIGGHQTGKTAIAINTINSLRPSRR